MPARRAKCPRCGVPIEVVDETPGTILTCPLCEAKSTVPITQAPLIVERSPPPPPPAEPPTAPPAPPAVSSETKVLLRIEQHLAKIDEHVGCLFTMFVVWAIVSVIGAMIVASQLPPRPW